ncbi:glycerophosphodiester phosphodiesterase [bacterium]|nr:glycerophosphodiester phosphodiesterase [bacterium]
MTERFRQIISGCPVILGHRGSPHHARENTVESFLLALEEGADGVELDVQPTRDGVPVVFHDDELPSGEVLASLTLKDLKDAAQRSNVHVHEVDEVLRVLSGKGFVNIELKHTGLEETCLEIARDIMPQETFLFSSFLPDVVKRIRALASDIPAILIVGENGHLEQTLQVARACDASGIAFYHELIDGALAEFFKREALPLFTWTVNDPVEAKRLIGLGVCGIITDRPGALRA